MDGWGDEIESEIAGWLEQRGKTSVADLARHLALAEEATASLIAVLMVGSPVQISWVIRSPNLAERSNVHHTRTSRPGNAPSVTSPPDNRSRDRSRRMSELIWATPAA